MAITNDTRVRNISPTNVKLLKKLSKIFEINTTTGVFLRLIPEYFENQKEIQQLRKKNTKLEQELANSKIELEALQGNVKTFFEIQERAKSQKEALIRAI